ncbi:MAG: hypothetical protein AAGE13_04210 [Pseudomonadota bacterium]
MSINSPALTDAVDALISEAEAASAEISNLRQQLALVEGRRRKLIIAVEAAAQALPETARGALGRRLRTLAEVMRPARGRRPDSRQAAILERLAALGHHGETHVKVVDLTEFLEKTGFNNLPSGYASGAMARLVEQGFAVKAGHGRFRINAHHPELVAIRFRLLDEEVAKDRALTKALEAAEARGRVAGRMGQ